MTTARLAMFVAIVLNLAACAATGGAGSADAPLLETHWTLVRLQSSPVATDAAAREPFLRLQQGGSRAFGSLGCNGLSRNYTIDGGRLSFSPLPHTHLACAKGMDIEQGFVQALDRTSGWRIQGQQLELLDAAGNTLAVLQAQAPPPPAP